MEKKKPNAPKIDVSTAIMLVKSCPRVVTWVTAVVVNTLLRGSLMVRVMLGLVRSEMTVNLALLSCVREFFTRSTAEGFDRV
jgi:hypothetical protein